jgi:amidase
MEAFPDYERYDATGLSELVRSKEIHPRELVEAAIGRIEERDPEINAVVYPAFDRARQAADAEPREGPFAGVPFLIKDLGAAFSGLPYAQSSRSRQDHVPAMDNEIVRRFRAAGLVILGKTNTPEFGLAPVTEPELHGPTRNPWDPNRTPCGSSGGSAAAVAAGMVPMAHGNDGGGSIRMPASACGLFGIKPTRGRSTWGPEYLEGWLGLSEQHAITRSVRDSARLLDATHGSDPGATSVAPPPERPFAEEVGEDPGRLRVAFTTGPLLDTEPLDRECAAAVSDVATLCAELGHEVDEATPAIDIAEIVDAFITLAGAEAAFQISESERITGRKVRSGDVELVTWIVGLIGRKRSAGELASAFEVIRRAGAILADFLTDYDVLLSSTLAQPPWPIGELELSGRDRATLQVVKRVPASPIMDSVVKQLSGEILRPMPNTPLFNLTGQPAMSVPLVWNEAGLPIGAQFAARLNEEATLFRLAAQLEAARPWADRRPPMAGSPLGSV